MLPIHSFPLAADLHLAVSHGPTAGAIRLTLVTLDGAGLAAERAARIEILGSGDLVRSARLWQAVSGPRFLTNGAMWIEPTVEPSLRTAFFMARESPEEPAVTVHDAASLRSAVAVARAGSRILLAPGTYPGGFYFPNVRGEPNRPVAIGAADPQNPPVIQGGGNGMHFSDPAFLELQDLVFRGATGNGLNIDDGGNFGTPARDVVLRGLRVADVGPDGNRDGIKLSGVVRFRVEGCSIERWGTGGSAIDMVGCHEGLIVGNVFRHTAAMAASNGSGVQAKGGSRNVMIRRNRFEYAGSRALNIGGSTGLEFFRPPLSGEGERWEAQGIHVEGNTFVGSLSPVAFVGVDGAVVRFNTFYRPQRWLIRILQETTAPGFVPCRGGHFTDNLVAFHSGEWSAGGVNVGANTAPSTFQFARNWWFCLDAPARSRPTLPVAETDGVYGRDPQFRDPAAGDLRLQPGSLAVGVGAEAFSE